MRILHIIGGGDTGGAKTHVLSLVKGLRLENTVKFISLRPGQFAEEGKLMGIDVEVVKNGNIFKDIGQVLAILRKDDYDIIHSHGAKANMFAAILGKLTGIPTVTTVHSDYRLDYLQSRAKSMTFGVINMIALRYIDFKTVVSDNFKNMLIDRKFDPNYIFTLYNGIDPDTIPKKFCGREEFWRRHGLDSMIKPTDTVVGILARLHPVKGVDVFVEAARTAVEQNQNIKFVIAGDGEERKNLEASVAKWKLEKNVFFLGWINTPYDFLDAIDINVLASMSESFPYSILEGAAMKKATVSSDVGGISDLISSGENGYLFKAGDSGTLGNMLAELASDRKKLEGFGEAIYAKTMKKFTVEHMVATQNGIYRSVKDLTERGINRRSKQEVVISGWYGMNNIGDDAILDSIIEGLREYRKDVRIAVLSKYPKRTSARYGVYSVNRYNIFKINKAMKGAALFINGGGTLIQDLTSSRTAKYYLFTIWLALRHDMRVMLFGNGIGPLRNKINRRLASKILDRADVITVRERDSLKELEKLNVTHPKIILTADPAVLLKREQAAGTPTLREIFGIPQGKKILGIAVRKWVGWNEYIKVIAEAVDRFCEDFGYVPVFIPLQYPNDTVLSEKIAGIMHTPSYIRDISRITADECTRCDGLIINTIGQADMLLGMRLHSIVFAAMNSVPCLGLVYDPKVQSFLDYMELSGICPSEKVEHLDSPKMYEDLVNAHRYADKIKEQQKNMISLLCQKAEENNKEAKMLLENRRSKK